MFFIRKSYPAETKVGPKWFGSTTIVALPDTESQIDDPGMFVLAFYAGGVPVPRIFRAAHTTPRKVSAKHTVKKTAR
jgi:hypothetical protein